MNVVVTGAGGFIGRHVVEKLRQHQVIAIDSNPEGIPDLPNVTPFAGDLLDRKFIQHTLDQDYDAIIHLAALPGGATEEDPDLGFRVNVEASMLLAQLAAERANPVQFVFGSSIAVYGEDLPSIVNEETPLAPSMKYGAHKVMVEQWLSAMARRGELEVISLRIPGVVARPPVPSGLQSAFLSEMFHSIRSGQSTVLPIAATSTVWVSSVHTVAGNLVHALSCDWPTPTGANGFSLTLPCVHTDVSSLAREIAVQSGQSIPSVSYQPVAAIERIFGRYPPIVTSSAERLGFVGDGGVKELVSKTF